MEDYGVFLFGQHLYMSAYERCPKGVFTYEFRVFLRLDDPVKFIEGETKGKRVQELLKFYHTTDLEKWIIREGLGPMSDGEMYTKVDIDLVGVAQEACPDLLKYIADRLIRASSAVVPKVSKLIIGCDNYIEHLERELAKYKEDVTNANKTIEKLEFENARIKGVYDNEVTLKIKNVNKIIRLRHAVEKLLAIADVWASKHFAPKSRDIINKTKKEFELDE